MSQILVAMSGGVDSSVAAALLLERGHRVIGATMKTFCYSEHEGPTKTCCGLDGIMDARSVANDLGIPHYVFDVEEQFTTDVIDNFVSEYASGRTPVPCVRCNSFTKFRDLLRRARVLGCDYIATGHYLRRTEIDGEVALLRGAYLPKDQSYFLWGVPRESLPQMLFPVGDLTKPEVRSLASQRSFSTADKPESMEICFVPDGNYVEFLRRALGDHHPALQAGRIVDTSGKVVGDHEGYAGFTVGQRKGLPGGQGRRLYVLNVDPRTRDVVVGERADLSSDRVRIIHTNWLIHPLAVGDRVQVQIRHRAAPANAMITSISEDATEVEVVLDQPQFAVTPGQSGVLYVPTGSDQEVYERLAGGGVIDHL